MIEFLQHKEDITAREIIAVQQPAYIKEAELIGFDGIPALQEKAKDIQASHEQFAGYRKDGRLIGVISYEKNMHHLTICRLVVHPDGFRKGIGRALLQFVIAQNEDAEKIEVVTAEKNKPAVSLYTQAGFQKVETVKASEDLLLSVFYLYPKRNVKVVHYNEKWAELFSEEKERLKLVFGPEIIAVHHIGSTSIPDMAAKPIIDMLIEVRSIEAVSQYDTQMKSIGYTPKGENGIAGRRYFQKGGNKRTHHVHMYEKGNPAIKRHLLFRDYLRAHPEVAKEYAVLKKRLAAQHPDSIHQYIQGKDDWIKTAEENAKRWKEGRNNANGSVVCYNSENDENGGLTL
ncbi:bifunctional GNAT family N-acetyltransferase/GrpB family protein [Bacillus inaquosorum]|uniref:bifunctional GNAT family N-acetyltransferase/GrpB family protein n=2 Tax=Bacillus inaquosorum TaxID=483913 RepID=UPI00227E4D66|nr:bifunctional GNAT family N-acetyltransferase/GrpB family protein [Bacillus inaquosorum]MCY7765406.1 bifunctional GNAT family N-acetyltransferase/GrpB family protein [Bacillus inaquosorum]MCY7951628.1 bifunctional GNAT family N-acetyltransferase/GrpB family protein [Bacillus inaquosorum]MCY7964304.1 bifunctional GNAT family N-acetyltransferase/GrpB family protein [Bacillus inaquosorum]MCY8235793.1 bifunctional GNAT family N-acetyltransferase/GrpB family protein [Bacillus inaquosorum]MCY87675